MVFRKRARTGGFPIASIAALVFAMLMATPQAFAEGQTFKPQGPFLDKRTGSYFQLFTDNVVSSSGGGHRSVWTDANEHAQKKVFEDRRGRLAVIGDLKTLDFIGEKFELSEATWIGLRFFCKFRKLLWVNGEIHPIKENALWARPWYRNGEITCSNQNMPFMPVYLTDKSSGPPRWQACGISKNFTSYLVEFPAPPKPTQESGDKPDQDGQRTEETE